MRAYAHTTARFDILPWWFSSLVVGHTSSLPAVAAAAAAAPSADSAGTKSTKFPGFQNTLGMCWHICETK
jgi:hypothetical protein